jgi:DNA polymerase-3 subunit gamma/tau
VPFEPAGVRLIAQAADGSMRDGLSLLDQLIAFGGGKAGEPEARAMLGSVARDHVVQIAELLGGENPGELLRCARALEEFAPDYAQVLDELAALLVRVGLKHAIKDYAGDELYAPELLERLAARLSPEDVQLYYQTAIIGRRDLPLAPDPRSGFEMTLLRMLAFRPAALAAAPATGEGTRAPATPAPSAAPGAAGGARAAEAASAASWGQVLSQLELGGAARQLAAHCVYIGRQGAVVRLALDPRNQLVRTPVQEERLAQALSRYYGEPVRLEFQAHMPAAETPAQAQRRASEEELAAARRAFDADPGVQGLRERFGATVLPESVRPVK